MEGLRAVAILLVLLYHAGLPWVPGGYVGVDVFFVVSGFLITTQLVTELDRTGKISLVRFYARRAKRLLPAAAIVLVTTAILVRLLIPRVRWGEIAGDIISSAFYFVNWRLADRSVDYLAEDSEESPVQHFWSLAVEEQFYLVWPLLILLVAVIARVGRTSTRPMLWLGLVAVAVPSFVWAVAETANSPASAFFITTTRMWELAVGAAVALGAGLFARLPRRAAIAIGWVGLGAIGLSGLVFTTGTPWPSYSAAAPTLGAAGVIAAGFAVTRGGPATLLGTVPFQWMGGLSYSVYLWHWPLLAVASAHFGGLSVFSGLAVAALSLIPAWITFRMVENPFRYSTAITRSPRLALSLGGNCTLVGAVAGMALLIAFSTAAQSNEQPVPHEALGAAVLGPNPLGDPAGAPVDWVDWMTPDPLQATNDLPTLYAEGCQQNQTESEVLVCEYGDTDSETVVAVVGDSKIVQWLPALRLIGEQSGWHIMTYTKSACAFAAAPQISSDGPYTSCTQWNDSVLAHLLGDPPTYVLTSQGRTVAATDRGELTAEAMVAGLRSVWQQLTAKGTHVVVVADNPHPGFNVYECVDINMDHLTSCTYPRERASKSAATVQRAAAENLENVGVVDMFDAICPTDPCAPVIGNVLVYRQGSHLTATYVKTLTPRLAAALFEVGMPVTFET